MRGSGANLESAPQNLSCAPCRGQGGVLHHGRWVECASCRGSGKENR